MQCKNGNPTINTSLKLSVNIYLRLVFHYFFDQDSKKSISRNNTVSHRNDNNQINY